MGQSAEKSKVRLSPVVGTVKDQAEEFGRGRNLQETFNKPRMAPVPFTPAGSAARARPATCLGKGRCGRHRNGLPKREPACQFHLRHSVAAGLHPRVPPGQVVRLAPWLARTTACGGVCRYPDRSGGGRTVCRRAARLALDLADEGKQSAAIHTARAWIAANLPGGVLNVAGPRASKHARVYDRAKAFLRALLGSGAG
jgi:hypothetical protein